MVRKTVAVLALAALLGTLSVSPGVAVSSAGTGDWSNTNSNAAQSRANLAEKVLTPSAVKKVQYLRSIVSPQISPRAACPGSVVAPLLAGGYLYAMTNDLLNKYDPATGQLIWRVTPDSSFTTTYVSLAISANLVVVGGYFCQSFSSPEGYIYAFNATTGAQVWTFNSINGADQAVTVSSSYVVAAGQTAAGYEVDVLNLSNGQQVWSGGGCLAASSTQPVVVGLVVMAYSCDNQDNTTVQAYNLAAGAPLWNLPAGWVIQSGDLAGSAGTNFYATDPSGTVEDLNPQTGQVKYALSQAADVLAVDTSRVYATCGSNGDYVCAYNLGTGSLEWQNTQFYRKYLQTPALAAEADGVLYLDLGFALNAATGKVITKIWESLDGGPGSATAIAVGDGRIAVVSDPRVLDLYGLAGY
jgi:outer membrane protein assembly factor BamB